MRINPFTLAIREVLHRILFECHWAAMLAWGWCRPGADRRELRERLRLFRTVRSYTWVSIPRLNTLYRLARQVSDAPEISGDFVECGVFNGGSAAVMAYGGVRQGTAPRDIWLFDSFKGLPPPGKKDASAAWEWVGKCRGDVESVKRIFGDVGIPQERVHFVKGWFKNTVPPAAGRIGAISLLHVDGDWYESVKLCLEHLYDKVSPGGFVVIDDYGYWKGCRMAVDEFIAQRGLRVRLTRVDRVGCYFQKDAPYAVA